MRPQAAKKALCIIGLDRSARTAIACSANLDYRLHHEHIPTPALNRLSS
jgi:hypothetical protein